MAAGKESNLVYYRLIEKCSIYPVGFRKRTSLEPKEARI
jgi:hypothetical protein